MILVVLTVMVGAIVGVPAGAASSSVRHWYCNANDPLPMTDMSDQQMMDEATFYPDMKGPISGSDCRALATDLLAARHYASHFPTAADAVKGGFHMIVPYVEGMGAHYVGPNGIGTTINPKVPNFLLYGGNGPNAPLVGLMWLVNSGQAPPAVGLPGGNDHWHRHMALCFVGGLVVGDGLADAQCAGMGGTNVNTSNLWMLHAWFVKGWQYRPDVFRPHVPAMTATPPA